MPHICNRCLKSFKTEKSLVKHKKTAKYCLENNNLEKNVNLDDKHLKNFNNVQKEENLYCNSDNYCRCPVFYLEDFIYDNFIWIVLAIFLILFIFFGRDNKVIADSNTTFSGFRVGGSDARFGFTFLSSSCIST